MSVIRQRISAPKNGFRERPPAYLFEPTFIREQLREAREAVLQEEEDYGYREPSEDPLDSVSA